MNRVSHSSRIRYSSFISHTWKSPITLKCKITVSFALQWSHFKMHPGAVSVYIKIFKLWNVDLLQRKWNFHYRMGKKSWLSRSFSPHTFCIMPLYNSIWGMQNSKLKVIVVYTIISYKMFECLIINGKMALKPPMIYITTYSIWQWKILYWSVWQI